MLFLSTRILQFKCDVSKDVRVHNDFRSSATPQHEKLVLPLCVLQLQSLEFLGNVLVPVAKKVCLLKTHRYIYYST
jgi:hypothetical protein